MQSTWMLTQIMVFMGITVPFLENDVIGCVVLAFAGVVIEIDATLQIREGFATY